MKMILLQGMIEAGKVIETANVGFQNVDDDQEGFKSTYLLAIARSLASYR